MYNRLHIITQMYSFFNEFKQNIRLFCSFSTFNPVCIAKGLYNIEM